MSSLGSVFGQAAALTAGSALAIYGISSVMTGDSDNSGPENAEARGRGYSVLTGMSVLAGITSAAIGGVAYLAGAKEVGAGALGAAIGFGGAGAFLGAARFTSDLALSEDKPKVSFN